MAKVSKHRKCPTCMGIGRCEDDSLCATCSGSGEIDYAEEIYVPEEPCWTPV